MQKTLIRGFKGHPCIDCGKPTASKITKRCRSCYMKIFILNSKNIRSYKIKCKKCGVDMIASNPNTKYCSNKCKLEMANRCIDCKKAIRKEFIRCQICYAKRMHGEAHPSYKHGLTKTGSKCIDCGARIGYRAKRCLKCKGISLSGARSPNYIDGRNTDREIYKKTVSSIPKIKIRSNISSGIRRRLQRRNSSKIGRSCMKHLDFTTEQLVKHLEKQFLVGMSWENRDKWHIDHIMPDSLFKYSSMDDEGFKRSWALSNLRPVWKTDNLKKNNKIFYGMKGPQLYLAV